MRIGVYFTPKKEQGGVYQYSLDILESFYELRGHKYFIFATSNDIPKKFQKSNRFEIIDMSSATRQLALVFRDFLAGSLSRLTTLIINFLYRLRLFTLLTPIYRFSQRGYLRKIDEFNLDLMFYPTSSDLSFLSSVPAVVTVHDLQHRLNPQFKEVSAGGRWEYREYGFINIAKKAFRVLVDSQVGKKQMHGFYPESKGKVVVLPYLTPSYLDGSYDKKTEDGVSRKYSLPKDYVFYPSKFWPHKNHKNIIKALNYLKRKRNKKVNLVLTGSKDADFSSYGDIKKLIANLDLEDQIFYLGYVSNLELSVIYKKASALVMPTYFGPTNIPVLEAWYMGTPVIYSDIEGCREQLGNAGLLVNPDDHRDIGEKMLKIFEDRELAKKLVVRGKKRLQIWKREDFINKIGGILDSFEEEVLNGQKDH